MATNFVDYYSLLGVTPDADPGEIRDAFRSATRAWHVDRWSNASEQHRARAEEMMKRINAAREILQDPGRRAQYDNSLRARRGPKMTSRASATNNPAAALKEIVLSCPHCRQAREFTGPTGRWMSLTCRQCSNSIVALVAAFCQTAVHRAAADGISQFTVRARMATGAEQLVTFSASRSAVVRERDIFSIVYAETVPATLYNHTLSTSWPLSRTVSRGAGRRRELLGLSFGFACCLTAYLLLRPAIGDLLSIVAILVGMLALAASKRLAPAVAHPASSLTAWRAKTKRGNDAPG